MTYSKCFECMKLTNLVCADCARNVPGHYVYVCADCRDEHLKKCKCRVDPPSPVWGNGGEFLQKYLDAYRVTPADMRRVKRARWIKRIPDVLLFLLSAAGCLIYTSDGSVTTGVICGLCALLWGAMLVVDIRRTR